nr:hypothetical protein [uncultured Flavobacterium sp.]
MSYNNNNNRYNNNNVYQNQNQNQPIYKKSGAVYTKIKEGEKAGYYVINAWRKTKHGLITAFVTPYPDYDANGKFAGITVHSSERGNEYIRVKVQLVDGIKTEKYYCLMNIKTKVVSINQLGLCITPNGRGVTKSGKRVEGYFGKNFKS